MSITQLQMELRATQQARVRLYKNDPDMDRRYAEISERYIQASIAQGLLGDAIAVYLNLQDISTALSLCARASAEDLKRGFANANSLITSSSKTLLPLLDILEANNLTPQDLDVNLGTCKTAIEEDSAELFNRGRRIGEIRLSDEVDQNHQIINAIDCCQENCRGPLATLLREGVHYSAKIDALRTDAAGYILSQAKTFLVLKSLGVELLASERRTLEREFVRLDFSNHARLRLENAMSVEQILALDFNTLT